MCVYVDVYMYVCMYMRVRVYVYVYIHSLYRLFFSFLWAFLTPHLFGVCLDDIRVCFMLILLNNKTHVIFVTCIINYFAYRHLVYK